MGRRVRLPSLQHMDYEELMPRKTSTSALPASPNRNEVASTTTHSWRGEAASYSPRTSGYVSGNLVPLLRPTKNPQDLCSVRHVVSSRPVGRCAHSENLLSRSKSRVSPLLKLPDKYKSRQSIFLYINFPFKSSSPPPPPPAQATWTPSPWPRPCWRCRR